MANAPTLRQRLRTAVLVPTTIAVALSCIVFVVLKWRNSLREHQQRLQTLATMVANNCVGPLSYHNAEDATRILRALTIEPAAKEAVVFDPQGRTFAAYRPSDEAPLPDSARPPGIYRESGRLLIFESIEQQRRRYGTLFIRWDLQPWYAEMRTYIFAAAVVLATTLGIGLLIGRVLRKNISEPVLALAATADQIARQKNYEVRAAVPETAELATFANAFNQMLAETQHVQAERARETQATRRAEQQLRLITDATPGLISYIDAEHRYRFVNRQYETWFGLKQTDILGRTMSDVLGPAVFARLKPHLDRAHAGEPVEFEVEAPYRDGGTRWIHAHYIPHRLPGGAIGGVFVLVLDVTERKRMESSLAEAHATLERHSHTLETTVQERTAALREAIGELEAFSYSIAHDMRAPLRSMQGFSTLLVEEHSGQLDETGKSYLRRITASADRLDRLIQDVLNYSRVVREEIRIENVDTQRLIDGILATYPNLQPPHAEIAVASPLPAVRANPAALTQVLSNLLGNAVKFVAPGTQPRVRIFAESIPPADSDRRARVRLNVADNGIGIPKDAQHRLFAMFQRLHRPELYEGTGMGLAIVRKAIERMGGALGVESESGHGSRFWFELEAAEEGA